MIADKIAALNRYADVISGASHIREFVEQNKFSGMKTGEWLVLNDSLRVILLEASNYTADIMESHEKNIDVHVTLTGIDQMNVAGTDNLEVHQVYDAANDYALWKGSAEVSATIKPGNFLFLAPHEGHNNELDKDSSKLVFKIPV